MFPHEEMKLQKPRGERPLVPVKKAGMTEEEFEKLRKNWLDYYGVSFGPFNMFGGDTKAVELLTTGPEKTVDTIELALV